jgi:hypothetical protein
MGTDPFNTLQIVQPVLAVWHTLWTHLSSIFECQWASLTSRDVSTLGFVANKLQRAAPCDLKKVDYYNYSQLLYLILKARILDCWRVKLCKDGVTILNHFAGAKADDLPTFEELYSATRELYQTYAEPDMFHCAKFGAFPEPGKSVPEGSKWIPPVQDESLHQGKWDSIII